MDCDCQDSGVPSGERRPVRHRRHHSDPHASPAALYRYGDEVVCKTTAFGSVCSIRTCSTIVASPQCIADQPSAMRDDDKGLALLRVALKALPLGGDMDKTQPTGIRKPHSVSVSGGSTTKASPIGWCSNLCGITSTGQRTRLRTEELRVRFLHAAPGTVV